MASPITFNKGNIDLGFSQHTIGTIQDLIKNINLPIEKGSPVDTILHIGGYKLILNHAFNMFCKEENPLGHTLSYPILSKLLTDYGFLRDDESSSACLALMRASLNAQFVMCKLQYGLCFDIKEIKNYTDIENLNSEIFNGFDEYILTSNMNAIGSKISQCNLSHESLNRMYETINYLEKNLRKTSGYGVIEQGKEEINRKRLDQLKALSAEIHRLMNK